MTRSTTAARAARDLSKPIVGIAATGSGRGYWLVAADGGIFNFGDASFKGSAGSSRLNNPIVAITSGSSGGYRIVASDGGIFSYGATYYGSLGNKALPVPVTTMAPTTDGRGYYLVDAAGDVYAFGDAVYLGNVTN